MGLMFQFVGRFFARFSFWQLAVLAFSFGGKLCSYSEANRCHLFYAMMRIHESARSQKLLMRFLKERSSGSYDLDLQRAQVAQQMGCFEEARSMALLAVTRDAAPEKIDAAAKMIFLLEGILDSSINGHFAEKIARLKLKTHERVVLTVVSEGFLPLFALWYQQKLRHVSGQLLVLSMDEKSCEQLRNYDCSVLDLHECFAFDVDGKILRIGKKSLWILRTVALLALVKRQHEVVSLDLDAMPVGDLQPVLDGFQDVDIVAQKDYSLPMDVARKRGFVLCCGVMVYRANRSVEQFLERYVERVFREMDDQVALNHLIDEASITNLREEDGNLYFVSDGVRWACPRVSEVSRDLHQGTVIRHFYKSGEDIDQLKAALGIEDPVAAQETMQIGVL